jgi:hypothetical protein
MGSPCVGILYSLAGVTQKIDGALKMHITELARRWDERTFNNLDILWKYQYHSNTIDNF